MADSKWQVCGRPSNPAAREVCRHDCQVRLRAGAATGQPKEQSGPGLDSRMCPLRPMCGRPVGSARGHARCTLNGPSGAGRSTLAQRYVDEHPGFLNLDMDVVVSVPLLGPPVVFSLLAQVRCAAAGPHR